MILREFLLEHLILVAPFSGENTRITEAEISELDFQR